MTDWEPGVSVFTLEMSGIKVIKPIELVSKVSVPDSHIVRHLILNDERELFESGRHPTADDSETSVLNPGDMLDGAGLLSTEKVRYSCGYTHDLLPAGETGFYLANGVLLGSTLPLIPVFKFVRFVKWRFNLSSANVESKALHYKTSSFVLTMSIKSRLHTFYLM